MSLARSPAARTAKPKITAKATICSTSPLAMDSTTLAGKTWTIVSVSVFGCACVITSAEAGGKITPCPGLIVFTTTKPTIRAKVVAISK